MDPLDKILDLTRVAVRVGDIKAIMPMKFDPEHPDTRTIMFIEGIDRAQYLEESYADLCEILEAAGMCVEPLDLENDND